MSGRDIETYVELELIAKREYGHACIFGAGSLGKKEAFLLLTVAGFTIDSYFDNYAGVGELVNGISVEPIDKLYSKEFKTVVFVCMSEKYRQEIEKQFSEHKIENYYFIDIKTYEMVMQSIDEAEEAIHLKYKDIYDDAIFIKEKFLERVGYNLDLDNPITFNEKLQFLKIHDRNSQYSMMADKVKAKELVSELVGEEYIIPTVGVWDKVDDIEIDSLPDRFVIKCNHDSGSIAICKDKGAFDWESVKRKYRRGLKANYFWQSREWPYKNISPKVLVENYMCDGENEVLPVYKFFCFSGKPVILQAIQNDKTSDECIDYYDMEWNKLDIRQNFENSKQERKCPTSFEEMKMLAAKLSKNIPFVRVDFYEIYGKVFFSEFTFFSDSGFERFYPDEWDRKLGSLIDISRSV